MYRLTPIFFLFIAPNFFGQFDYGRSLVDTLCSETFFGRGYTRDGHIKAAEFLENEFKNLGVDAFGGMYKQYFHLRANTFPKEQILIVDGDTLRVGEDFVPHGYSGSGVGEYQCKVVDVNNLGEFQKQIESESVKDSFIYVIDDSGSSDPDTTKWFGDVGINLSLYAPVIFLEEKKFTWTVGRASLKNPIIEVLSSKMKGATSVKLTIENEFHEQLKSQNVIGFVEGKKKDKYIFVTAHYDHLGGIGDVYFPGANDNASGVAMMMSLAKYYAKNKPKYSMVFIAFGGEEAGLLGSKHFVEHPVVDLEKVKFVINTDIFGTGDEGITIVNGTIHKKQFKKISKINQKKDYLKKIVVRGRAANSDHYWFTQKEVPAIFIYTMGGIQAYHDVYDKAETLPLTEFNDLHFLLRDFIRSF